MKEAVRQRALELGFDDCRFTTAQPPASAAQFQNWLDAGKHGAMAYLERNAPKRMEPQLVLPGAKSVVALAASYGEVQSPESRVQSKNSYAESPPSALRPPPSGLAARYARFDDYHDVLGVRLKSLTGFVNQLGGAETRSLWYVDTGPVSTYQSERVPSPPSWLTNSASDFKHAPSTSW